MLRPVPEPRDGTSMMSNSTTAQQARWAVNWNSEATTIVQPNPKDLPNTVTFNEQVERTSLEQSLMTRGGVSPHDDSKHTFARCGRNTLCQSRQVREAAARAPRESEISSQESNSGAGSWQHGAGGRLAADREGEMRCVMGRKKKVSAAQLA